MKHRDMVEEALGLRRGNNRWRAIWRVANQHHRDAYSKILGREVNKKFKTIYGAKIEDLFWGTTNPLFANIPLT